MEINEIADVLRTKIPNQNILMNEVMKNHTSFKIGGPADLFVMPTNAEELINTVKICRLYDIPYYVIGNGSNLLIDDVGFRGIIIQLYKNISDIEIFL